jgi:hypothetical protein
MSDMQAGVVGGVLKLERIAVIGKFKKVSLCCG